MGRYWLFVPRIWEAAPQRQPTSTGVSLCSKAAPSASAGRMFLKESERPK